MIGLILKRRYCVLEQLGKGGQGSLYLARDLELGTLWAVKELPLEKKHEAKLLRLLDHPSLPRMIDYLEKDDHCYLVMEYIRGYSLQQWMEKGRCFSTEEVMDFGKTLCGVLGYLHSQNPPVIYGDLKPDNLMLTESGHLYLVDFGASVTFYGKEPGQCMGTRGYAAPEQYEGRICESSDIFGLGKVLEALLGKKRWRCLLRNPRLGFLLWKCTRKEPRLRPENMAEVEAVLTKAAACAKKNSFSVVGSLALLGVCAGLAVFVLYHGAGIPPLEGALTEVMEGYYAPAFVKEARSGAAGRRKEIEHICRETEKKLQSLLKKYADMESQRRLLLLLAYNGELMGELSRSALYYEQLLLYDEDWKAGYEHYGRFLERQGQEQAGEQLMEDWKRREGKAEAFGENWLYTTVHAMELGGFDVQVGAGENIQLPENWEQDFSAGGSQVPSGETPSDGTGTQVEAVLPTAGAAVTPEKVPEAAPTAAAAVVPEKAPAAAPTAAAETPPEGIFAEDFTGGWEDAPGETSTATPTNAPTVTPVVTPTVTPTVTPVESPAAAEPSPTAEPLVPAYYRPEQEAGKEKQRLKVCYFREKVEKTGEIRAEIRGTRSFYPLSVRVDGQEAAWEEDRQGIRLLGTADEGALLQIAGVCAQEDFIRINLSE